MFKLGYYEVDGLDGDKFLVKARQPINERWCDLIALLGILDISPQCDFQYVIDALDEEHGYVTMLNGDMYGALTLKDISQEQYDAMASTDAFLIYDESLLSTLYLSVKHLVDSGESLPDDLMELANENKPLLAEAFEMLTAYIKAGMLFSLDWFTGDGSDSPISKEKVQAFISNPINTKRFFDRAFMDFASISVDSECPLQAGAEVCVLIDFNPVFNLAIWFNYIVTMVEVADGYNFNFESVNGRKYVQLISEHSGCIDGMTENETNEFIQQHLAYHKSVELKVMDKISSHILNK